MRESSLHRARRVAILLTVLFLLMSGAAGLSLQASALASSAVGEAVATTPAAVPASTPALLLGWDGKFVENLSGGLCWAGALVEGPRGSEHRSWLLSPGERRRPAPGAGERVVCLRGWRA